MVHISFSATLLGAASFSILANGRSIERSNSLREHDALSPKARSGNGYSELSRGRKAVCFTSIVPVEVSATNANFNYQLPANNSQVTQTFLSLVSSRSPFMEELMGGEAQVSDTYNIFTQLCLPSSDAKPKTVQFLTHGVGFNHIYWDFAPGYSYVDAAAEIGYATFLYDRLGVGQSSKPDAIEVVQSPLELAIAEKLIQDLRIGYFGDLAFQKVVAVGHSFGSIITEALAANYPGSIDAAILTGFSANMSANAAFTLGLDLGIASQVDSERFQGLWNGYIIPNNFAGFETGFLKAPGFDSQLAEDAYKTADTATFGELFSQAAISKPALEFTGPVAIVNGEADLPFCFGNCSFPTDLAAAPLPMLFPKSIARTSYLAQDAGHGLNLHYSASAAFKFIHQFLFNNGITPM